MSATDRESAKGREVDENVTDVAGASASSGGMDAAWTYLENHRDADAKTATIDLAALRRKIDFRIVPLMFLCYTLQFLDKVILNVCLPKICLPTLLQRLTICSRAKYAAVMGIRTDLNLQGNDFSNVATFLFVGLLCFEIPNSKKSRPICTS
jgi:hypothetical protein